MVEPQVTPPCSSIHMLLLLGVIFHLAPLKQELKQQQSSAAVPTLNITHSWTIPPLHTLLFPPSLFSSSLLPPPSSLLRLLHPPSIGPSATGLLLPATS